MFKIEREPGGQKVALIRMFDGTMRIRDRLRFGRAGDTVTDQRCRGGAGAPAEAVTAGRIARVWGLAHARMGDSRPSSRYLGRGIRAHTWKRWSSPPGPPRQPACTRP